MFTARIVVSTLRGEDIWKEKESTDVMEIDLIYSSVVRQIKMSKEKTYFVNTDDLLSLIAGLYQ